jgi:uncharacterized protein
MQFVTPANVIAALLLLFPYLAVAFFPQRAASLVGSLPLAVRLAAPALLCVPYILVAFSGGVFTWPWLALYALLPVLVAVLLWDAARIDLAQRGNLRDYLVLLALGLAVDLRWLEPAWPSRLAVLGKLTLLDAGLYAFLAVRCLSRVGYDLRFRGRDWATGFREFLFYMPIAIPLGLAIGFLHFHHRVEHPWLVAPLWVVSFVGVALPEEVFFRGWIQNLLERRIGRTAALIVTETLFGLSHFNKRTKFFNWRYVLLAALAGIFYGRAWRRDNRVAASAITHATVDTLWGALLK